MNELIEQRMSKFMLKPRLNHWEIYFAVFVTYSNKMFSILSSLVYGDFIYVMYADIAVV